MDDSFSQTSSGHGPRTKKQVELYLNNLTNESNSIDLSTENNELYEGIYNRLKFIRDRAAEYEQAFYAKIQVSGYPELVKRVNDFNAEMGAIKSMFTQVFTGTLETDDQNNLYMKKLPIKQMDNSQFESNKKEIERISDEVKVNTLAEDFFNSQQGAEGIKNVVSDVCAKNIMPKIAEAFSTKVKGNKSSKISEVDKDIIVKLISSQDPSTKQISAEGKAILNIPSAHDIIEKQDKFMMDKNNNTNDKIQNNSIGKEAMRNRLLSLQNSSNETVQRAIQIMIDNIDKIDFQAGSTNLIGAMGELYNMALFNAILRQNGQITPTASETDSRNLTAPIDAVITISDVLNAAEEFNLGVSVKNYMPKDTRYRFIVDEPFKNFIEEYTLTAEAASIIDILLQFFAIREQNQPFQKVIDGLGPNKKPIRPGSLEKYTSFYETAFSNGIQNMTQNDKGQFSIETNSSLAKFLDSYIDQFLRLTISQARNTVGNTENTLVDKMLLSGTETYLSQTTFFNIDGQIVPVSAMLTALINRIMSQSNIINSSGYKFVQTLNKNNSFENNLDDCPKLNQFSDGIKLKGEVYVDFVLIINEAISAAKSSAK